MSRRELISRRTRNEFREAFSRWGVIRTIHVAFDNERFSPDRSYEPDTSGARRSLVEQYYHAIDFADPHQVRRLLRVYQDLIADVAASSPETAQKLRSCLEGDGCRFENGRPVLAQPHIRLEDLRATAAAIDAAGILTPIERIESAIEADPALAIGTAKELVESCCKTILAARQAPADHSADLPQLIKATMKQLKLVPDDVPNTVRGAETVRRMLSNLGTIVSGLAEMRNLYGSGHGRSGKARGLSSRHAKLAAGAATTLAVFLFETHTDRP